MSLTGLSIAQISTDQEVRTGGGYSMVSRSLGSDIGGAIGVPLYFAQAPPQSQLSRVGEDEAVFRGLGHQEVQSVTIGGPGLVAVGSESEISEEGDSKNGSAWPLGALLTTTSDSPVASGSRFPRGVFDIVEAPS